MRKILILSLLLTLLAGGAEAKQDPWEWEHGIPIDGMTGKKDYTREKVAIVNIIENKRSWTAGLELFCNHDGNLVFSVADGTKDFEQVSLDTIYSPIILSESRLLITDLRLKFDNNEPILTRWFIIPIEPGEAVLPGKTPEWLGDIRWKEIIKGMKKHRRLWIGFNVQGIPYIAKFNLIGFSRELAKCSRIPDTN